MKRAAAALMLLAARFAFCAPSPQLLREVRLLPSGHAVRNLAFSPDERWVAVSSQTELVLLQIEGSSEQALRFDAGAPILWGPEWSPNSDDVLIGTVGPANETTAQLYDVKCGLLWKRDGGRARLLERLPAGGVSGFIDNDHLMARQVAAKGKASAFLTLDRHGAAIGSWPVPKGWEIGAVNAGRRLIAVFSDQDQSQTMVLDYQSKQTIQSFKTTTWLYANGNRSDPVSLFFSEGGKTLCAVGTDASRALNAECRDVDTGAKLAEFRPFTGGMPGAASADAPLVVLTQATKFWSAKRPEIDSYGERVVWDFRANTEIAVWGTLGQMLHRSGYMQPAPVAISPSGKYVAEAADGLFRIYQIPAHSR